jgi:hypothetical protein
MAQQKRARHGTAINLPFNLLRIAPVHIYAIIRLKYNQNSYTQANMPGYCDRRFTVAHSFPKNANPFLK